VHLVHPALVHFAVAFLVAGGLLEAWGILARRAEAERLGAAIVVAGVIVLVPTVASGIVALNSVDLPPAARAMASDHECAAWLILGTFLALMLWKGWNRGRLPEGQRKPFALALIAAVALVVYGALLGGRLVYGYGVGTVLT